MSNFPSTPSHAHRPRVIAAVSALVLAVGLLAWSGSAVASGSGGDDYWFTAAHVVSSSGSGFAIEAEAVAVSADDTVFVTGNLIGTVSFPTGRPAPDDSITITSAGYSMYVGSINPDDTKFSWVVPVSAPGDSVVGMGMSVTSDGTPLVTGYFGGTATFPTGPASSISLTATGNTDGFVAALNRDDSYFAWAVAAGGYGGSAGFDLAYPDALTVTADDTPIITGFFSNTVSFPTGRAAPDDSITLAGSSDSDVFVAAVNPDGSGFAWAVMASSNDDAYAYGISVTGDDTPVVTGQFTGTLTFPTGRVAPDDSITLTSSSSSYSDAFVAALNRDDSTFAWAVKAGGTRRDSGQSLAFTSDDTAIITGYFENTASFPTGPGASISLTSAGSQDLFVAGMSADDSYFSWAVKAGGAGGDFGYGVAVTSDDTPLITGYFTGSARFPTGQPAPDDSISLTTSPATGALFVAGMGLVDPVFSWASGAEGTADSYGLGIAATSSGTPVAAGATFSGGLEFPTGPSSSLSFTATTGRSLVMAWLGPFAAPPAPSAPTITGLSPATGSTAGGTSVTITGTDFTGATAVTFGGSAAAITSNTATQIVATTPTGTAGAVAVAVTTAGGTATSPGAFTYVADPPPDPAPPATYPPSQPLDVSGVGTDASAVVSWSAPTAAGSFPISNYQAVVSPGAHMCMVVAPATSCAIDDLTNGIAYTASVRALNGAGWGAFSASSETFTPRVPSPPKLSIAWQRGVVRDKPGVIVTGTSTGIAEGVVLRPWFRFPGQPGYRKGKARVLVQADGSFTWQRRAAKRIDVVMKTKDGSVRSNRITIPAR